MLSKNKDERRGEGFPKQVVRRPIPEGALESETVFGEGNRVSLDAVIPLSLTSGRGWLVARATEPWWLLSRRPAIQKPCAYL